MPDDLDSLYDHPLAASRQGPLYNAFSYPTKISAESVAVFIACHTKPGDRVLDVFAGSGTTGIAAQLCERPTPKMLQLAIDIGVSPEWGRRDATIYELSEIGGLLGRAMTHAPNPELFAEAAERVIRRAEGARPGLYDTIAPDGTLGVVRHIIWSDCVRCPACGHETTYAQTRVAYEPLRFVDEHECERCAHRGNADGWARVIETRTDLWSGQEITGRKRVPWRVYGKTRSRNWSRPATEADAAAERSIRGESAPDGGPILELQWGDLYRRGYHQGMTHLHHLYTARNFAALAALNAALDAEPVELQDALRLFILSYNASHSTLMTRVVLKKQSVDFVLTGAQSGVLYVSGLPVEKNVFVGLRRKIAVFKQAFALMEGRTGNVEVVVGSSTTLDLPDASIDYVFTDPPFGAYIPYAEINQINELWMSRRTDIEHEAIVSPAQKKGVREYEDLLAMVFSEVSRVLKTEAEATVVFHSSHADIWQALARSLERAELAVHAASILDKTQSSFKQVNGHVAVSGDPLLRVRHSRAARSTSEVADVSELPAELRVVVETARGSDRANALTKRTREHAYARAVGKALVAGVPVTVGAHEFYLRDEEQS